MTTTLIRTHATRIEGRPMIKCAHCTQYHEFVWEVRVCAANSNAAKVFQQSTNKRCGSCPWDEGCDVCLRSTPISDIYQETQVTNPRQSSTASYVPAGFYALPIDGTTAFYRVQRPTEGRWAGRLFLDQQAGDEFYPIRNHAQRNYILSLIAVDPRGASVRYGHEIGRCGVCSRTLTNEQSRAAGIGPVCAEKMGW